MEDDRSKWLALLGASTGLLGARRGQVWPSVSQGLLGGIQAGIQYDQNQARQKMQAEMFALQQRKLDEELALRKREQDRRDRFSNGLLPQQVTPPQTFQPEPNPAGVTTAPLASQQEPPSLREQLLNMGIPEVALATAASSEDPAKAISDLVKEFSKPVFGQGKIPLVRGRTGFRAEVPQGFNEALAAQAEAETRATEGAKAGFDIVDVPMGDGTTQRMTRDQAIRRLGGGSATQAPAAGRQDVSGSFGGTLGRTKAPEVQAQDTEIAKAQGVDYTSILTAERSAPGNIGKYELLKDYLGKVNTGRLAPTVQGLKSIAAYVAPDLAKEWTKDVPFAQAATALSREMALQLRNPAGGAGMPGALSDSDRKYLESMVPGLANDPRSVPVLLDMKIAMEKRAQDIGKIARDYRKQYGRIDEGFYAAVQDFANRNPLFNASPAPAAPGGWSITPVQ